jgi:HAD superfamily hydrolase (TIGR01509 family)
MAASNQIALGKRIAQLRRAAHITQESLAEQAGLAYSTLTKIEQGTIASPSIFTIMALAKALGTSLEDLTDYRPEVSAEHAGAGEIRFLYFDIHGVITTNWARIFTELAARFHLEPQSVELAFWRYNDILGRGHITLEEFETALARNLRIKVKRLPYAEVYADTVRGNRKVHELMRELSEHYQIGLLTNIFPGFLDKLLEKGAVPALPYTVKIESCTVGAVKPERAIYEYAQAQAGVRPEHMLLIDDTRANLDAAQHLGWQVFWFDEVHPEHSITRLRHRLLPE